MPDIDHSRQFDSNQDHLTSYTETVFFSLSEIVKPGFHYDIN